jgi:pimeloyl-ACP methyl ester carboxylesterase
MQEKEFDYNGNKLFYRTKGEGPLVILLHGFGEDGTIWRNQYDIFSDHQLIVPDLPGSGRSEMIEDMTMEGMADAVKAIMTHAGLAGKEEGWAALIGHSMGGYITLAFAEKYPELLNRFGLFHSTAYADNEEKKETRRRGIEFINRNGGFEFLKTVILKLYAPASKDEHPEWVEQQLAAVRNVNGTSLVSYYQAMMQRQDRTDVLRNSKLPVLFIMGRHDTAVPLVDGLRLCHLPQLSYIHILENSGHTGMIEQADEAIKILKQFISAD